MNNISATLKSKDIVKCRLKKGLPVYNYGLGANSIPQPKYLIDKMKEYSNKKYYTSSEGVDKLNKAIKNNFTNNNYTVDKVLFGNGLKELLFVVQLCFEGKILHITPSWLSYKEQINILKKQDNLIEVKTTIENNFKVDIELLEQILKENENHNKIIIFNNPNNPTGLIYTPKEVEDMALIFKKYNCIVFADEIYMNINHFNEIESISSFIPELTIRGSSVSKDLACGGYRLGWITFPKSLNELFLKCRAAASSIYSCPCTPIQYACADMLKNKKELTDFFEYNNNVYKLISKKCCDILSKSKLKFIRPMSAWYIFVDFSNYQEELSKLNIKSSVELNNYLTEQFGIITVSGNNFSSNKLTLRFSLVDLNFNEKNISINIEKGLKKLITFLKEL